MKFLFISSLLFFGTFFQVFSQKIYIHTDRDKYVSGDTLWFNAYIFDEQTLQPAADQTFYVQLVNDRNQVLGNGTLFAVGGIAHNYIPIADSIKGKCQLIAYTKAQIEQKQTDFLYRKNISVSEFSFQKTKFQIDTTDIDIQFLPEGGHLIANLPAVVAFRAIDKNGNTIDVDGLVLTVDKEEVTEFKSTFKGTGLFGFLPKIEQKYQAKVIYNQKSYLFDLPTVEENGIVMRVSHQEKDSIVTLRVYQNIEPIQHLKLQILARGRVYIEQDIGSKDINIVKIAKNVLPKGIVKINILRDSVVLLERLLCVNRTTPIDFKITTSTANPKPNEKIEINILAYQAGKPVETELSLSVTDIEKGNQQETTLFSYLFLQSEISGYISQPTYYFDITEIDSYKNLDLLLLTQGWTKYRWNEKTFKNDIETAPLIEGLVTAYGSDKPSKDIQLTYSYLNNIQQLKTDERGIFKIENHDIQQSNQVYFQARKRSNDLYNIKIVEQKIEGLYKKIFSSNILQEQIAQPVIPEKQANPNTNTSTVAEKSLDLKEVVITANTIEKEVVEQMIREIGLDNPINLVMQDHYEVLNDLPEIKSLNQLIKKKIADVHITVQDLCLDGSPMAETIRFLAISIPGPLGVTPVPIFLNKSLKCVLCREGRLESIVSASEVHKLIFIKPTVDYLPVLIIVTKNSIPNYDYSKDKVLGTLITKGLGFSTNKEFYSPKYENGKQSTKPDYRATLYWNPNIKTDKDGKVTVSFYNSDIAKKFNISIEGTDGKGNVGSLQKVVE